MWNSNFNIIFLNIGMITIGICYNIRDKILQENSNMLVIMSNDSIPNNDKIHVDKFKITEKHNHLDDEQMEESLMKTFLESNLNKLRHSQRKAGDKGGTQEVKSDPFFNLLDRLMSTILGDNFKTKVKGKVARQEFSSGPFYNFLYRVMSTILDDNFEIEYLPTYMSIVEKNLKNQGAGSSMRSEIRDLRKRIRKMIKKHGDDPYKIRNQIQDYEIFITVNKTSRWKFYSAMDALYSVQETVLMDNYLLDLRDYGAARLGEDQIDYKTYDILRGVIFGAYHRASNSLQENVRLAFEAALLEYRDLDILYKIIHKL